MITVTAIRALINHVSLPARVERSERSGWCHASAAKNSASPVRGGQDLPLDIPAGSPTPGREQSHQK